MRVEGFTLRGALADGARPFRYRAGVGELLGLPEDLDVRVTFAAAPPGVGFAYVRPAHRVVEEPVTGPPVVTEVVTFDPGEEREAEDGAVEIAGPVRLEPKRLERPGPPAGEAPAPGQAGRRAAPEAAPAAPPAPAVGGGGPAVVDIPGLTGPRPGAVPARAAAGTGRPGTPDPASRGPALAARDTPEAPDAGAGRPAEARPTGALTARARAAGRPRLPAPGPPGPRPAPPPVTGEEARAPGRPGRGVVPVPAGPDRAPRSLPAPPAWTVDGPVGPAPAPSPTPAPVAPPPARPPAAAAPRVRPPQGSGAAALIRPAARSLDRAQPAPVQPEPAPPAPAPLLAPPPAPVVVVRRAPDPGPIAFWQRRHLGRRPRAYR